MGNPLTDAEVTVSKLRFYSLGIVASNKLLASKEVEVVPIEDVPLTNGEITSNYDEYSAKAVDNMGASYESSVKTTVSIKATWLALNSSNRLTAPDVRRGEEVILFQFDNVDKYYWVTRSEDIKLRKLETVIYGFSATNKENADATADTTYYLEISTHKKLVHFHSSKDNGEPFGYDIQLNTKEGYLTITDDAGNYIHLNSAERRIQFANVDGCEFDMLNRNMRINAPDDCIINAKNFIVNSDKTSISGAGSITIVSPNTTVD